jgi:hypothetical protein
MELPQITDYVDYKDPRKDKPLKLFYEMLNLLRRWTVRAGNEHPDLAEKTLWLIKGRG